MVADILDNWPVPASKFLRVADRSTRVRKNARSFFRISGETQRKKKEKRGEEGKWRGEKHGSKRRRRVANRGNSMADPSREG